MGNLVCRRHGGGGGAVVVVVAPAFVNIHQCLHPSIHPYRQADLTCVPLHTCYVHLLKKYKYLHPVHHSIIIVHYITLHYITLHYSTVHTYIHPTSSHPRNHSQTSNIFTFSGVPGRFSWTACGLPCVECLETDGKNHSFSLCHFDVTSRLWDVSLLLLDVEGHALVFIWQQHHY